MSNRAGGDVDSVTSPASPVGGCSVTPAGMRMVTTGGTTEDHGDETMSLRDNEPFTELSTDPVSSDDIERTVIYHESDDLCGSCKRGFFNRSSKCIECDKCSVWYHISCAGVNSQQYEYYNEPQNGSAQWLCRLD